MKERAKVTMPKVKPPLLLTEAKIKKKTALLFWGQTRLTHTSPGLLSPVL